MSRRTLRVISIRLKTEKIALAGSLVQGSQHRKETTTKSGYVAVLQLIVPNKAATKKGQTEPLVGMQVHAILDIADATTQYE